jgi:type VI protein secretion system component Hcp
MSTSLLLLEFIPKSGVIKGDCTIVGYEGHITLQSFSWGVKAEDKKDKNSPKGEFLTIHKLDNLTVSKYCDGASVPMINMMNADTEFIRAVLRYVDPSSNPTGGASAGSEFDPILEIEMLKGYIESISIEASDSGKSISLVEKLSLKFNQVKLQYYAFDPKSKTRTKPTSFESSQPKVI